MNVFPRSQGYSPEHCLPFEIDTLLFSKLLLYQAKGTAVQRIYDSAMIPTTCRIMQSQTCIQVISGPGYPEIYISLVTEQKLHILYNLTVVYRCTFTRFE
jgi:hypothetical protein